MTVPLDSYDQQKEEGGVSPRVLLLMIALYANLIVWMLAGLIVLLLPRFFVITLARAWSRYYLWLCRIVGGIKVEFRGL